MQGRAVSPFVQSVQRKGGAAGDVGVTTPESIRGTSHIGFEPKKQPWALRPSSRMRIRYQVVVPALGVALVTHLVRTVAHRGIGMGWREIDGSQHVGVKASRAAHPQTQTIADDLSLLQVRDIT